MKIFKYAYYNISKKLFLNFIIMIQVMATCFLFYSVLDVNNKIAEESNKILNVFNNKKAWYMKVSSEFNHNYSKGLFTCDDILNAYKVIKEGDFSHFYLSDTSFLVKDFKDSNDFIANPVTKIIDNAKYISVKGFSMDKEMNKEFNLPLSSGQGFKDTDFEKISDRIPVILGNDYTGKYEVGDTITSLHPIKGSTYTLKVIGILNPDSYLLYKIDTGSEFLNLNNSIVAPFIDLDKVPKDTLLTDYRIQSFDLFNTSYFLFDSSKSDVSIETTMKELNDKFQKLHLGKLNIRSAEEYIALNKESLNSQKKHSETLSIIVTLFLSIGITSSLMYTIKREKGDIGVHILNGATLNDIAVITLVQNLMIMFMGLLTSLGIIKITYSSINYRFMIYISIILILLSILISIIPIATIRKLNVNELIRSDE